MMMSLLSEFALQGKVKGIGLGDNIARLNTGELVASAITNANGEPELYLATIDGFVFNVGVDLEQNISYLVLHFKDQEHRSLSIALADSSIELIDVAIDNLIAWLNANSIDWFFCLHFEKIIKLQIVQSSIEFVFDFNVYDDINSGLLSINCVPKPIYSVD